MVEIRQTKEYAQWFDALPHSYRVYFLRQKERLVILLAGGDKSSQERDIRKALRLAQELEE